MKLTEAQAALLKRAAAYERGISLKTPSEKRVAKRLHALGMGRSVHDLFFEVSEAGRTALSAKEAE